MAAKKRAAEFCAKSRNFLHVDRSMGRRKGGKALSGPEREGALAGRRPLAEGLIEVPPSRARRCVGADSEVPCRKRMPSGQGLSVGCVHEA